MDHSWLPWGHSTHLRKHLRLSTLPEEKNKVLLKDGIAYLRITRLCMLKMSHSPRMNLIFDYNSIIYLIC